MNENEAKKFLQNEKYIIKEILQMMEITSDAQYFANNTGMQHKNYFKFRK